ncbi:uncharacterized protein LOC126985881 isoform X2 [Eriocheir sinensis]|uniref:uncharacterized protein LOC126985881 isoform X2 n=1 Tax=Eriocheir sinensis TaxID=95602 RepID=UPI0021C585AB|nr:uncharacterized protein LOC126985881 isoform X2 [Eriocheir sinensis]
MGYVCCAVGCSNRHGRDAVSFYRFPANPEERGKWIVAVRRENWRPSASSRLCSAHFVRGKRHFDPLSPDFVPSIFNHTSRRERERRFKAAEDYERRQEMKRRRLESESRTSAAKALVSLPEDGGIQGQSSEPCWHHTSFQERQRILTEVASSERKETTKRCVKTEDKTAAAIDLVSSGVISVKGSDNTKSTTVQGGSAALYPSNKFVTDIQNPTLIVPSENIDSPSDTPHQALNTNLSTKVKDEKNLADDGLDFDSCLTVKYESIDDSPSQNFENNVASGDVIRNVIWVDQLQIADPDKTDGSSMTDIDQLQIADPHKTDSSTMTDMYASYITSLDQECQALRNKCFALEEKRNKLSLAEEAFKGNDAKVKYFTGLPTFSVLMDTFSFISDHLEDQPRLTKFQQYVLTLMRLKHNSSALDLSYRFDVYSPIVSKVFHNVLDVCMTRLVPALVSWPESEYSFPVALVNDFPKCAAIINCLEMTIVPALAGKEERREACISHKPRTMKYLIAVSPQGSLSYISKGWMGTYSDKHVAENCGILDKLGPEDEILADKGFNTATRVVLYGTALTEGRKEMVTIKVGKTKMSTDVQSYVGKVMGPAYAAGRRYAMLQSTMPSSLLKKVADTGFTALDQVVCVACALTSVGAAAAEISQTLEVGQR